MAVSGLPKVVIHSPYLPGPHGQPSRPKRKSLFRVLTIVALVVLASLCAIIIQDIGGRLSRFMFVDQPPPARPYHRHTYNAQPSSFVLDPSAYGDGGPRPVEIVPEFDFDPTPPKSPDMVVPDVVHYVSLSPDGRSPELTYWQYLSIRSVIVVQAPAVIHLHCDVAPHGIWWDEVKSYITLSHVEKPKKIFGNDVSELAHRSDILRLLAIQALGGVYLDFDVYLVRPLDDLMYAPMTMGMQGDFYGLCNSVLISEPHSSFVGRYIDSYRQFRQEWWDWNSVVRSFELARAHPTEVQVLKESAFFVPNWDRAAIVFEGDEHDVDASGQYLLHAWHKIVADKLAMVNPDNVVRHNKTYNKLVRKYMGENDLAIWEKSHKV